MEKRNNFSKRSKKLLKKKKQLIRTSKQKLSMNKLKYKIVVINILNNSKKEKLLILVLKTKIFIFITKKVDVIIINADIYYITCKLKNTQIFAIFIKNLEY